MPCLKCNLFGMRFFFPILLCVCYDAEAHCLEIRVTVQCCTDLLTCKHAFCPVLMSPGVGVGTETSLLHYTLRTLMFDIIGYFMLNVFCHV